MGSTTGTAMTAALKKYISSGYRTVDGWLSAIAIKSTAELGALQKRLGVSDAVSEIGVHHRRLFNLLHLLTDAPEKSVAWDLFESQYENADGSGHGDRRLLQTNLIKHGCDLSRIKINTVNSLTLTASRITAECESKVRIFSVDGGHSAASMLVGGVQGRADADASVVALQHQELVVVERHQGGGAAALGCCIQLISILGHRFSCRGIEFHDAIHGAVAGAFIQHGAL